jgi:hypothetical protein
MPAASLSVPHYKQEWPNSCVAACVRMVLAHYGQFRIEQGVRLRKPPFSLRCNSDA